MLKHAYMLSFVALATCVPLAAFETKKYNPPRLQELAANVCVREAAKDKSFYEKLKQTALTAVGLVPFKSTKLFTKTSVNRWGTGTYEITVSSPLNLLFTRDANNLSALHTYEQGIIKGVNLPYFTRTDTDYTDAVLATDNFTHVVFFKANGSLTTVQTNTREEIIPSRPLSLRLASQAFADRNLSFFAAPNGRDILVYNDETAKVHRTWSATGDDAREMRMPKCDFYAISNDGSLFVGCKKSKQEKKCTLHIINLAQHFYPATQHEESATPQNISRAIKLPLKAGTISISPDNKHVALVPAWSMIPSDKSREPECVYIHTVKDLLANQADMPQAKEFFCPKGKKPSCITWIQKDCIALASEKGDITLHNHETGEGLFKMRSHNHRVTALAYDPVKNFLFAGYESTKKGQMLELITLDNAKPLSDEHHAIAAILHRACKNKVWADHFDTENKKLPQHAQQLISATMPSSMRYDLEAKKRERVHAQAAFDALARCNIKKSASLGCTVS